MNRLSSKHLDEAVATGVITSDQRKGILELAPYMPADGS